MKKLLVVFALAGLMTACSSDDNDAVRVCGDFEVSMEFDAENTDNLHAVINGDALDLTRVESASGAKYQGVLNDIVVVLWEKGEDWTLMLDEDTIVECAAK